MWNELVMAIVWLYGIALAMLIISILRGLIGVFFK